MKKMMKNSRGMSLIEVMIVMTIMSLIGLGTATLMKNMFSIQRRSNLKNLAQEIQKNLEAVLKNDTAWAASINGNASLACLRDTPTPAGGCIARNPPPLPSVAGALASNFNIHDASGAAWYNASVANAGFSARDTDPGEPCNAFSAVGGSGSDDCPFRYNIFMFTECPPAIGSPCLKPQVTLRAILTFNPEDPSDPRNRLNTADYTINIRRGERFRYEPFKIQFELTSAAGGGNCPTPIGNWGPRPLNNSIEYDAGNNVISINGPAGEFRLAPGTYECKVVAQAYEARDGFSIRLEDTDNGRAYPIGSGYSGFNSTAYVNGSTIFQLAAPATFQLQHACSGPLSEQAANNYEMGIPARFPGGGYTSPSGDGTVVTSITCIRSS